MSPDFSVVLATRDRPVLFAEALDSVLTQTHTSLEVIVVDDGSTEECAAAYKPIWDRAAGLLSSRFSLVTLVRRPRGHGQSYSLNVGVGAARGRHVCFLDDDDKWTDRAHLARAASVIEAASLAGGKVDLYMANQGAWIDEHRPVGTLWLGMLEQELRQRGRAPDPLGTYRVDATDLMATAGFCHLNCLTVRRELYQQVGGMDEGVRWECDRDLMLKLVDEAQCMVFHPGVMSYHRVPDPTKTTNMTTTLGVLEKRLLQSIVLDRALIRARHPAIRQHARQHKVYAVERIAAEFATRGDWSSALFYAGQAFGARPSPGRAALLLRCLMKRQAS